MKITTKAEAIAFRKQIEAACGNLDDKAASESPSLFNHMKYDGQAIAAGTRINFEGVLYKATVTLWDTEENNPDHAPTLWEKVNYHNGVRIIPEIITVTSAFALGELGFNEKDGLVYESLIAANVYTPEAYPAGWKMIG